MHDFFKKNKRPQAKSKNNKKANQNKIPNQINKKKPDHS